MQSKLHFLISLETIVNAAVDLAFWLLVLVGRVAIPFAQRVILPAAKKLGRELLMSAAPELNDVAMKKKSLEQALKTLSQKTARKQLGGGRRRQKTPMNGLRRRWSVRVFWICLKSNLL